MPAITGCSSIKLTHQNKVEKSEKPTSLSVWELLWRCKRVKGRTNSSSLSPTWFYGKCRARSGVSDSLELSLGSLCCGCAIGSDESKIKRQMKKLSRRESWEIKEKMKKMEMMMLMNREMKKNKEMHVYIKVANIHFNPPSKLAFKSNSFSCNLVLNCNLVSKLIPN